MIRTKRRRLFIDIETSPNIGFFWKAGYKQRIDYDNIIHERKIICICYKWEEEKEVYSLHWDSKQSDKKIVEQISKILAQATEVVFHNGDKFDLPWIRGRALFHKLEMFPHYSTIDTLKISRSKFNLNSNRLDYLAKYLGIGGKIKTDYSLWRSVVIDKCPKAMEAMIKYCKKDVVLLENVFNRLKTHINSKVHYGVLFGGDRGTCPECGSDDIKIDNRRTTATGIKKIQYKCNTCGRYNSKTDK